MDLKKEYNEDLVIDGKPAVLDHVSSVMKGSGTRSQKDCLIDSGRCWQW